MPNNTSVVFRIEEFRIYCIQHKCQSHWTRPDHSASSLCCSGTLNPAPTPVKLVSIQLVLVGPVSWVYLIWGRHRTVPLAGTLSEQPRWLPLTLAERYKSRIQFMAKLSIKNSGHCIASTFQGRSCSKMSNLGPRRFVHFDRPPLWPAIPGAAPR